MSIIKSTISRRAVLKGAAATGAMTLAAPAIVRSAFASSGELNFLGWAGYDMFPEVFAAFETATGIKVNFTGMGSQDEMLAQAKTGAATNGDFDLCEPTIDRLPNWVENDFVQAMDEAAIGAEGVEKSFLTGYVGGKLMASPSVWGSESLTVNTDEVKLEYGTASLGDLFDDQYAGKLVLRGHSGLAAAGRWLDTQPGALPFPFDEGYKDPEKMVAIWDKVLEFALSKRKNIAQFWSNENEAQGAFRTNGCVIGLNWDTSAAALAKEGLPIAYLQPKEGSFAWAQNFVMLKGAKNVEQANAWLKWMNSPEGGALWAAAFGASPCAKGAVEKMSPEAQTFFKASYPSDSLAKLWWWPVQESWFVEKRTEYATKFVSA